MLRTESKLVEDLQYYCTFAVSSAINSSRRINSKRISDYMYSLTPLPFLRLIVEDVVYYLRISVYLL